MEGRLSRIPVPGRLHRPEPSAELQITFPSKRKCVSKATEPEFSRVPSFNFSSNVAVDSVFKAANQGSLSRLPMPDKRVEPVSKKTVPRRPLSRHQLETELKKKNQFVEALKQQQASAEQDTVKLKELKKENQRLVQENEKLKKIQDTCMMILESRNISPGSNIEEEKEMRACQEKTTMIMKAVSKGLTLFCDTVAKQSEMFETAMTKLKSVHKENQHALEKQSYSQAQTKECIAMLEALGELLAM